MIEKRAILEQVLPFWEELTGEQQMLLENSARTGHFDRKQTLFNPLKKDSGLKIVCKGQMRVSMLSARGGEILLYQLREKEICVLSILSLMKQFTWNIYVEAEKDSIIMTIPEKEYLWVSEENPAVKAYNQKIIIQRMGEVIEITSRIAMATIEERLADLLLRYQSQEVSEVLLLTHEGIAKDMGTAREVISRTLKQFQNQGLVELGRGKITILDAEGIRKIKKG